MITPTQILVVEDEPHFERLIQQRFRKKIRAKEYEFVFAINGIEALEKLQEHQEIDIVLSDINMPKMDGLTFISRLKEAESKTKVIMVSAYGDMTNIRKAMNQGAYDFVPKPIDFADLEATIEKAIEEIREKRMAQETRRELNSLQQELSIASKIQQSILPRNFSMLSTKGPYDIFSEMIPAKQVGGDFYDFFMIDKYRLALVIGDVSGKGISAALFMTVSRSLVKAYGLKGLSAGECLESVNSLLSQDNISDFFVTIFYGVLNLENGELDYCSGGHNPAYIISPDQSVNSLVDNQHIPLGILPNYKYRSQKIVLEPGSTLALYTDGITEARDQHQTFFSEDRLEHYLEGCQDQTPQEVVEGLIKAVQDFSANAPQADDITMMAVKHEFVPEIP